MAFIRILALMIANRFIDLPLIKIRLLHLYGSIRLESMRDGINDFSLLSLLKRRNSALAEEIVNKMVFRFDWYDTSISNFRLIRKKILEGLEN